MTEPNERERKLALEIIDSDPDEDEAREHAARVIARYRAELLSPANVLREADALEALDLAWEQRCDSYDPWPDNDDSNSPNDGPHDATAKHVFDLLRDALTEAYAALTAQQSSEGE